MSLAARSARTTASRAFFASRAFSTNSSVREALALEEIDTNLFRAPSSVLWRPPAARGVFGGQIIGHAMSAAAETLPEEDKNGEEFSLHSMHSYFMLKGDPSRDVVYTVERLRNGRSFHTREVTARQRGEAIFTAQLSFMRKEESPLEHQDEMPTAPDPETLPRMEDGLRAILSDARLPADSPTRAAIEEFLAQPLAIDIRPCEQSDPLAPGKRPSNNMVWMKALEPLGDASAHLHMCLAAYASDWSLATSSLRPHGLAVGHPKLAFITSLDHSMWFHEPFRVDEWLLYEMWSPRAAGARGLNFGRIFKQSGELAVTVAQEALMRLKRKK